MRPNLTGAPSHSALAAERAVRTEYSKQALSRHLPPSPQAQLLALRPRKLHPRYLLAMTNPDHKGLISILDWLCCPRGTALAAFR